MADPPAVTLSYLTRGTFGGDGVGSSSDTIMVSLYLHGRIWPKGLVKVATA